MKTKIVFAVTGGINDIYIPQAMLAAYSARKANPNSFIILVVDQDTAKVIDRSLPKIKDYLNDIVIIKTPDGMSGMHKSRYIKTSLRQHIEGDFLYIDTDTIVTSSLSEIDNVTFDVAAVLDRHSVVGSHEFKKSIIKDIEPLGMNIADLRNKYFNSGVMYVKETPTAHKFYEKWHYNWQKSLNYGKGIDQPPLALANKQCGYPIGELDGIWNCQLSDNFLNYLSDAKILHYFASNKRSPYKLYDDKIFKTILKTGDISDKLKERLEHPKNLFQDRHVLAYGYDVPYLRTNVHSMYVYHRWLYNVFEYISKVIVKKHF